MAEWRGKNMTLIISKQGTTIRLEKQPFENEAALQQYIYDCPEAIPLDELSAGAKLFVLGREFPTNSGPIDVLGTDQVGHPYIIETKLYKNPDKRLVLAQVLDYGAALWSNPPSAELLLEALREDAAKRHKSDPIERLAAFLDKDDVTSERQLAVIAEALSEGRFTAIVLMDRLDQRLRNLINFLNDNSGFQLLAVELDYYRHEDSEIVSPRMFGAEARRKGGGKPPKPPTDPNEWLADWERKYGETAVAAWRTFIASALASGILGLRLGHYPSGMPYLYLAELPVGPVYLFRLAGAGPEVRDDLFRAKVFNADPLAQAARERFRSAMIGVVPGAYYGGDSGRVFAPVEAVAEARDSVVRAIAEFADSLQSIRRA
jgi:hypothetical protein